MSLFLSRFSIPHDIWHVNVDAVCAVSITRFTIIMSLIYWEKVLADPAVPFDVTFRIVDHEHDNRVFLISAHKLVLGLTSPMLKSQLSGSLGQSQVIEVEDVSPSTFRMMINYIYGIPMPYSVEFLTFDDVHQILNTAHAAKKYQIPQLTDEIVALVSKAVFSISSDVNAIEDMANQFSFLGDVSQAVLSKCKEEKERVKQECDISRAMVIRQAQMQAVLDDPLDIFFSDSDSDF